MKKLLLCLPLCLCGCVRIVAPSCTPVPPAIPICSAVSGCKPAQPIINSEPYILGPSITCNPEPCPPVALWAPAELVSPTPAEGITNSDDPSVIAVFYHGEAR